MICMILTCVHDDYIVRHSDTLPLAWWRPVGWASWWLVDGFAGLAELAGWLAGWLVGWLAELAELVDGLAGWLSWLMGWLAGWHGKLVSAITSCTTHLWA